MVGEHVALLHIVLLSFVAIGALIVGFGLGAIVFFFVVSLETHSSAAEAASDVLASIASAFGRPAPERAQSDNPPSLPSHALLPPSPSKSRVVIVAFRDHGNLS